MYQSFNSMDPKTMWTKAIYEIEQSNAGHPRIDVAGGATVEISAEAMNGLWTLRFGRFGCPDSEMRGGVILVTADAVAGGDNDFAYCGRWDLDGTELTASLDVLRHGTNVDQTTIFGTLDSAYHLDCVAEAITADLFEGRLRLPGRPDVRFVMRRLPATNGGNC